MTRVTEEKLGMIQYYIRVYQSILDYTKAYQGIQENINVYQSYP